jgi:uncharacterized protein YlxP (DUF503 family)
MALCYFEIKLDLPFSQSLKEKRGTVKSIIARTSIKFNVSIAEVDMNDVWKSALLGVSIVANDGKVFDGMINTLIRYLEFNYPDIIITVNSKEIL